MIIQQLFNIALGSKFITIPFKYMTFVHFIRCMQHQLRYIFINYFHFPEYKIMPVCIGTLQTVTHTHIPVRNKQKMVLQVVQHCTIQNNKCIAVTNTQNQIGVNKNIEEYHTT